MTNKRNIYLLQGFSLYYDRRLKYYNTLEEYLDNCTSYEVTTTANFNPNDGVSTSIILNTKAPLAKWDYLLVVNYDNYDALDTPNGYEIESRWFIMDANRQRGNQYQFTLRRDVIIENYDKVLDAPCFIEKAIATKSNNLILNSEGANLNQIKSDEIKLYDTSGSGWIVGYVDRESPVTSKTITIDYINTSKYDIAMSNEEWTTFISDYEGQTIGNIYSATGTCKYALVPAPFNIAKFYANEFDFINRTTRRTHDYGDETQNTSVLVKTFESNTQFWWEYGPSDVSDLLGFFADDLNLTINEAKRQTALSYQNKIIKVGTTYYKINVDTTDKQATGTFAFGPEGTDYIGYQLYSARKYYPAASIFPAAYSYQKSTDNPDAPAFTYYIKANAVTLSYETIQPEQETVTIDKNRTHCTDSPYDMFCIPYGTQVSFLDGGTLITMDKNFALTCAIQIAKGLDSASYDVQILPYCPITQNLVTVGGSIAIPVSSVDCTPITKGGDTIGYIAWCQYSTFTSYLSYKDNDYTIDIRDLSDIDYKIENESTMYRISSPNYAASFEIKPTRNGGILTNWVAECTYKPFNPYICVHPEFRGLYGSNYKDGRGLICSGDFSLPQVTGAWESYEMQNKNYQDIFNRQVEHMEVTQKYSETQQLVKSITGSISGAAGGAAAGMMVGGPAAAVAGGLVGGLTSAVGGAVDYSMLKNLNKENIDYTKDNFELQLGNIKARPDTLTKVGVLTPNFKVVPVLEKYTCTPEERLALQQKITYTGMTINDVSTIRRYISDTQQYIKGKILRLGIEDDNHMAEAIYEEIQKGVYI